MNTKKMAWLAMLMPRGKDFPRLVSLPAFRSGKSVVIRTSTRQTIYLPVPGLVGTNDLIPGELVGTNKDSYLILEKLPAEFDSRVKVCHTQYNYVQKITLGDGGRRKTNGRVFRHWWL